MSDTEISISTGETVEITYSISSTGELDEIIDIDTENKEFEDYDFKNIKKFIWTPTDDDVGTHEFTVNGEEISIEVNEIPDSVSENLDVWYQMNEGMNNDIFDSLELQDADYNGTANWTSVSEAIGGTVPDFNGTNNRIVTKSKINADSYSWCCWFRVIGDSNADVFGRSADKNSHQSDGSPTDYRVRANIGDSLNAGARVTAFSGNTTGAATISFDLQANTWYFGAGFVESNGADELWVFDASGDKIGHDRDTSNTGDWDHGEQFNLYGFAPDQNEYQEIQIDGGGFVVNNEINEIVWQNIAKDTRHD